MLHGIMKTDMGTLHWNTSTMEPFEIYSSKFPANRTHYSQVRIFTSFRQRFMSFISI